jgi:hypothetical protein
MQIISRTEARSCGLRFFFTGIPCRKGHICPRYVSEGRCRDCDRNAAAVHRTKYRDIRNAYSRNYRSANIEYFSAYWTANRQRLAIAARARWNEDINYRIGARIRQRLCGALKGRCKPAPTVESLGCSLDEFRKYIESKFYNGMTWANWGRRSWHLDHIMPLASFDLSDPTEYAAACHFTNYQPLWWLDNLSKGSRVA